jgi:putative ABC transport system permease protein
MFSDLRFALRALARNRSFTAVTVLTLALGIGSAAAIFSVTDWILFRASTFPADVFLIGGRNDATPSMPVRFDFMARAYAEQSEAIADYAKSAVMTGNVVIDGQPVAAGWVGVSANLLPMLGITPRLGRGFLPGEDQDGADRVIVVSHRFWQRHLGGRSDALGRTITVGDQPCTVVGVLREAQNLPAYLYHEIYRPLSYRVNPAQPWIPSLFLWARMRPGFTRQQAWQSLDAVKLDVPAPLRPFVVNDHPVFTSIDEVNQVMRVETYWVMFGAVGFLYAIACLNASNLMLVRMLGQRRELCIRLALGGGRWRIVRLLAVESVTLAVAASLIGMLLANWLFPLLLRAAGNSAFAADWSSWHLNGRVLAVLGLLSIITSLAIVIIPAVRVLRTDIQSGLKDGGAALGESRALGRLRGTFVVVQAAFAVILLAGAGLMIRTFHQLRQVDLGFDPERRAKVQLGFPTDFPLDPEPRFARLREIQSELQRIPGVTAVGFGCDVMLSGYYVPQFSFERPGGSQLRASLLGFNADFHEASGFKLKSGRWLTPASTNEVLVNEAFARACWPGQDAVGQLLRPVGDGHFGPPEWKGWVVAGVVGDVRTTLRAAPEYYLYSPEMWAPYNFNTFILRLARDYDEALAGTIRRKLYDYHPRLVVTQVAPLAQVRNHQLWAEQLADSVLKVLAGIALILTVVGLFSVLAYTVDRRMNEFGVRLALGATRRDLVQLVLSRGLRLTAAGIGLGLAGALVLTRSLQSLLFETSAHDPSVLAAVAALLLLISALACIGPAVRATRADVSRLLRSE